VCAGTLKNLQLYPTVLTFVPVVEDEDVGVLVEAEASDVLW